MNQLIERIKNTFTESIHTHISTADSLINIIAEASEEIVQVLLEGKKILICGNGSSACLALNFTTQMINRFKDERPGLPAIVLSADLPSLTAIADDYHFSDVFAKQVRTIGHPSDLLIVISHTGNSPNIMNAIKAGHDKQMSIIAFNGGDGGKLVELLREKDIEIRVPSFDTARIQETHLLILNSICDIIDFRLFGHGEKA